MVAITFRTGGAWGAGSGANLTAAQVDGNFYALKQAVESLEESPPEAVSVSEIIQSANTITFYLTDGSTQGPFTLPAAQINFRGAWAATTAYVVGDVVSAESGLYIVTYNHTSASTFDAGANDGTGHDYYNQILAPALPTGGTTGQLLAKASGTDYDVEWIDAPAAPEVGTLADVTLTSPAENDVLTFDGTGWVNAPAAGGGGVVDVQTFDEFGTWTKPASGTMAYVEVWGGGGGAGRGSSELPGGGGGGAYNAKLFRLSELAATEYADVGSGGLGRTSTAGTGGYGMASQFSSGATMVKANGGEGGGRFIPGGGGTPFSDGAIVQPIMEGSTYRANHQHWNGGHGWYGDVVGHSLYGGAGGGGGLSVYGGNGGDRAATPTNGTAPGGGGGPSSSMNVNGANGAAGRIRVTVW